MIAENFSEIITEHHQKACRKHAEIDMHSEKKIIAVLAAE